MGGDDLSYKYWESDLTEAQEKVLTLLHVIAGSASIVASGTLVYIIMALHSSYSSSYTRLILGLSAFDVGSSLTNCISPFLLSEGSRVWAQGNQGTCSLMGFFVQFSMVGAVLYNGMLSFFFFMVVRVGMTPKQFAKRLEPICHLIAIGQPLITASAGLLWGIYGEAKFGMNCWISEYPIGCNDDEEIECTGDEIGWVIAGLPFMIVFLWIVGSNISIYRHLRRTQRTQHEMEPDIKSEIPEATGVVESVREDGNIDSVNEPQEQSRKSTIEDEHDSSDEERDEQTHDKRTQAMVSQALWYVCSFFLSFGWMFIAKIIESDPEFTANKESKVYPLLVLVSFFSPLQGVFTLSVYTRPSYIQCRMAFPNETRIWCVRRAWAGSQVRPTTRRTTRSPSDEVILDSWWSLAFSRAESHFTGKSTASRPPTVPTTK